MKRNVYKILSKLGVKFQVWRLHDYAEYSKDGRWENIFAPNFSCPIHLYRIRGFR